ncbi:MAG: HD domain-containing phosphohydrolase [Psychrobium sp.]
MKTNGLATGVAMTRGDLKILVVDDVPNNVKVLLNILKEEGLSLSFSLSGHDAINLAQQERFDLILLDVMMPGINGFDACKAIHHTSLNSDTPIIFISARTDVESISRGFAIGGVDYIVKPFHPDEIIARVNTHLELSLNRRQLKSQLNEISHRSAHKEARLMEEIEQSQRDMIHVLMELMEMTSDETGQHIRRVADCAKLLAQYMPQLDDDDVCLIYHATPMHDIGKVVIDKSILHKPARLTPEEFEIMKTHTSKAAALFPKSKRRIINAASIIAIEHHERWDGTGYPNGLAGDEIHLYARIVALADVFDALTHNRTYKPAWPVDKALDYIRQERGKHFDPQVVDIFFQHIDEFIAILDDEQSATL